MPVLMVRSKKDQAGNAADAEAAIKRVFSAIEQAQPAGVRYASSRLADGVGVSFVVLLKLEDGVDNPLLHCPRSWSSENLKQWMAEPPTVEQMTVVGSYRLF